MRQIHGDMVAMCPFGIYGCLVIVLPFLVGVSQCYQLSDSSLSSTGTGVCMDGVESKDSKDDVNWLPSLRALVLAAGDDVCGVMEW